MTYIQAGSNPESLEVWRGERVHITWKDRMGKDRGIDCSNRQWSGLFWKIWAEQLEVGFIPIGYGKYISVVELAYDFMRETEVSKETWESIKGSPEKICKDNSIGFLIKLKVSKHTIYMWKSTWEYLKNNIFKHMNLHNEKPPEKNLETEEVGGI